MASGNTGTQAKYGSYCCAVWSVWSRQQPDGTRSFATVRGHGNPGSGFIQERSSLCCEDAAAFAGSVAGCGLFRLSNGRVVRFTDKGPVSLSGGP